MKKCPKCELNYIKDDEEICSICKEQIFPSSSKSDSKTFYSMGLKYGDQIEFIYNTEFKPTIYSENTVWFEDKEWHLTPLMTELCKRTKMRTNFGSGFEVFRFDDKDISLYTRWNRYNNASH